MSPDREFEYRVSAYNDHGRGRNTDKVKGKSVKDPDQPLWQPEIHEVPADWELLPEGVDWKPGDRFRLMFITSETRDAHSPRIQDYNRFVQESAAAGHDEIQPYSSGFRVVASTAAIDALDNTGMNWSGEARGLPVYWLKGDRVADDYADFYDGDWDDPRVGRTLKPLESKTYPLDNWIYEAERADYVYTDEHGASMWDRHCDGEHWNSGSNGSWSTPDPLPCIATGSDNQGRVFFDSYSERCGSLLGLGGSCHDVTFGRPVRVQPYQLGRGLIFDEAGPLHFRYREKQPAFYLRDAPDGSLERVNMSDGLIAYEFFFYGLSPIFEVEGACKTVWCAEADVAQGANDDGGIGYSAFGGHPGSTIEPGTFSYDDVEYTVTALVNKSPTGSLSIDLSPMPAVRVFEALQLRVGEVALPFHEATRYAEDGRFTWTDDAFNADNTPVTDGAALTLSITPDAPAIAPAEPESLIARASTSTVELRWSPPTHDGGAEVSGYTVERSTFGVTWSEVGRTGGTGWDDSSPSEGETFYRVSARNSVGTGDAANVSITINPPGAPDSLEASASGSKILLEWSAPSDDGGAPVVGYTVERSEDGVAWSEVASPTETFWLDASVRLGQTRYRVSARNAASTGAAAQTSITINPPGAPTGLSLTAGAGKIAASWSAPSDDGGIDLAGYEIEWKRPGAESWSDRLTRAGNYTLIGLIDGASYTVRVRARNVGGWGPYTAELTTPAGTDGADALQPPVVLSHEAIAHGAVQLDWNDVTGAASYEVQFYLAGQGWRTLPAGAVTIEFDGSSATLRNLQGGLLWWLRLRAAASGTTSAWSEILQLLPTKLTDFPLVTEQQSADGGEVKSDSQKQKSEEQEPKADQQQAALTASFVEDTIPAAHSGKQFDVRIQFSQALKTSYRVLLSELQATNGQKLEFKRHQGSNAIWEIHIKPTLADGDVTLTLPASANCTDATSICTATLQPLSEAVTLTVPAVVVATQTVVAKESVSEPLTASFVEDTIPAAHGGKKFDVRIQFSQALKTRFAILLSELQATNGQKLQFKRHQGSNAIWEIHIKPTLADADVTLTLPASANCTDATSICTAGLQPLSEAVTLTVPAVVVESDDETGGDGQDDGQGDGQDNGGQGTPSAPEPSVVVCESTEGEPDLAADTSTTCALEAPGSVRGARSTAGDSDWYRVSLQSSATYQVDMRGKGSGEWLLVDGVATYVSLGTLEDPKLLGIYDAEGALIPGTDAETATDHKDSRIASFTPSADGNYYIAASAEVGWTGTYELSVSVTAGTHVAQTSEVIPTTSGPGAEQQSALLSEVVADPEPEPEPVVQESNAETPTTGFLQVDAGWTHMCALRVDGTVECWGNFSRGGGTRPIPDTIPEGIFTQIVAGNDSSCGIREDDSALCWHDTRIAPGSGVTNVRQLHTQTQTGACWLTEGGTIGCSFRHSPPGSGDGYKMVTAGYQFSCAIDADDEIVCSGSNWAGERWSGFSSDDKFKFIRAGGYRLCGIRMDDDPSGGVDHEDTLVCWSTFKGQEGLTGLGQFHHSAQLANGTPEGKFKYVDTGYRNTCAVRKGGDTDGEMVCWSDKKTYGLHSVPDNSDYKTASVDWYSHACGLKTDGTIRCWNSKGEQVDTPSVDSPWHDNAKLLSLELSGVEFEFDRDTTSYSISVDHSLSSTTVTAGATNSLATVSYSGTDADANTDGHQVNLTAGGDTEITVTVVAADGVTTQSYTVTITRAAR